MVKNTYLNLFNANVQMWSLFRPKEVVNGGLRGDRKTSAVLPSYILHEADYILDSLCVKTVYTSRALIRIILTCLKFCYN